MDFLWLLSDLRTPVGDAFFSAVTYLGHEFLTVGLICWLYWCISKRFAYILGFSYFFSGTIVQTLKITFRIPRPWNLDPEFKAVQSAIPAATGYSFPSGHTQSATTLFGTLALYVKKGWQKAVCVALIVLVGFSRMYLGVHTPLDVTVGFLTAAVCVILISVIIKNSPEGIQHTGILTILLLLFSAGMAVYSIALMDRGTIALEYAQDCLKAGGAGMAFGIGFWLDAQKLHLEIPSGRGARLLRLAIGLPVTAVLYIVLKVIAGSSLASCFIRYFILVFWVMILAPLLFARIEKKRS